MRTSSGDVSSPQLKIAVCDGTGNYFNATLRPRSMAGRAFSASFLKLDRAKTHLQELDRLVAAYVESEPVDLSMEITERGALFKIDRYRPLPIQSSAIVGDIFHNLRSSLDLMAAELCGPPGRPDPDVYFPFCAEEPELDAMIKRRNFDRAGSAALQLLKEWRPYRGGNIELRAIHDLNIRDKHKMLILHPVSFGGPIIDTKAPGGRWAIVGDPKKPSSIDVGFPEDCELAGRHLIPTLHSLIELTARIIESFRLLTVP